MKENLYEKLINGLQEMGNGFLQDDSSQVTTTSKNKTLSHLSAKKTRSDNCIRSQVDRIPPFSFYIRKRLLYFFFMFTIGKGIIKKEFNPTDVTTPMTNKQTSERGRYGYSE